MVYAKLNTGIKYVQGMNELLAPLYYVCRNDPTPGHAACAEEDSFYLLTELLAGTGRLTLWIPGRTWEPCVH